MAYTAFVAFPSSYYFERFSRLALRTKSCIERACLNFKKIASKDDFGPEGWESNYY